MRNLKTVEKKVRAILEKNEDARNDDMVLYLALCNVCLKDAGAIPLIKVMELKNRLTDMEMQSVYFRGCYDSVGYLKKAGIL